MQSERATTAVCPDWVRAEAFHRRSRNWEVALPVVLQKLLEDI